MANKEILGKTTILAGATLIDPSAAITIELSSHQQDFDPSGYMVDGVIQISYIILDLTGNINIGGLKAPDPAVIAKIVFFNKSAFRGTFTSSDSGSLSSNRFNLKVNAKVDELESITMTYLPSIASWVIESVGEV